ncbi:MAG TPA: hypothetical protein VE174_09235 [Actinomycetota bacterium]|nr:hypothetical protein [Actinomycetota bacterium]
MSLILPIPADGRCRRFLALFTGLALYGLSVSLLVVADLGLDPWDVLHQGIARRTGISIGISTIVISAVVLLLWIPLRQRPGLGTLSNAVLIGVAMDVSLALLPRPGAMAWRVTFMIVGIVLNGLATGLYIGAGMGPGPRDGLMTGLAARGGSIRVVRTAIELSVLAIGFVLGGSVGVGTVAYALSIGPLAHLTIPLFTIGDAEPARAREIPMGADRPIGG